MKVNHAHFDPNGSIPFGRSSALSLWVLHKGCLYLWGGGGGSDTHGLHAVILVTHGISLVEGILLAHLIPIDLNLTNSTRLRNHP